MNALKQSTYIFNLPIQRWPPLEDLKPNVILYDPTRATWLIGGDLRGISTGAEGDFQ